MLIKPYPAKLANLSTSSADDLVEAISRTTGPRLCPFEMGDFFPESRATPEVARIGT